MKTSDTSSYIIATLAVVALVGVLVWASRPPRAEAPSTLEQATFEVVGTAGDAGSSSAQRAEAGTSAARLYVIEGVRIIYYTDSGFDPFVTEVKRGYDVRFVNESDLALRVAKLDLPQKDGYAGLSQSASIGREGTYSVNFTKLGTWGFSNLNNPAHKGAIVVIP